MRWKRCLGFSFAAVLGGTLAAQGQNPAPAIAPFPSTLQPYRMVVQAPADTTPAPTPAPGPAPGGGLPSAETRSQMFATEEGAPPPEEPGLGPTPLLKVGILNDLIYGEGAADAKIKFAAWMDFDYTFRSTGTGINNIAPVMNRFGDEFLVRQLGIYISKATTQELSWGFNCIFIGGADAAFIGPTAGGWANTNPRFGSSFTDLN